MWKAVRMVLWTLRLALPKVAVGWMFALLTIDFNRVAIVEMGVAAVIVTSLLSIHYFLAPFQVISGRLADTRPLFGYRRTPYLIIASTVASLLFLALPSVTFAMSEGSNIAFLAAVCLFVMFGLCMATIADSFHSLIAEVTSEEARAGVISVVWVVMILSTIMAAVVMNAVRPEFSREAMQTLYNLTPFIVIGSVLLGVVGVEKRLGKEELEAARVQALALAPPGNPLVSALQLVKTNEQVRRFFIFIACAIFAIFLQEGLIEVFGAEVFGMGVKETTRFQPIWGGGILLGMLLAGVLSSLLKIPKKLVTITGCVAAAGGFFLLGFIALFKLEGMLVPALFIMGLCAGVFNVGALALMMDMTVKGATGLYMGLWGVAQAMGMGLSSVAAGSLHTSLISSGLLVPETAYWAIFCAEASLLLSAAYALSLVSTAEFHRSARTPVAMQAAMQPGVHGKGPAAEATRSGASILDVATAST